ncbi:MAG: alternative ribosome rescue aminoacyl-tRNA hydrolase ArfB [Candidatus Latescibacteria bacterium]|nr:alternative ribosome rescue aminoacyl-tRNA hydrolase ArfB [Candidatus Latescibacterota bacterium]
MIEVTPGIRIAEDELSFSFVRASGPGGQNVNKVSTAVQLRFDAANSPNLPEAVRARALRLAGRRATTEGVIVLDARRHRTQERNRQDAIDRLMALLQRAAEPPKPRTSTTPTRASRLKRLDDKRRRAAVKRARTQRDEE